MHRLLADTPCLLSLDQMGREWGAEFHMGTEWDDVQQHFRADHTLCIPGKGSYVCDVVSGVL